MIRFTPYAWAKYIFLRDIGKTEVGAFGISSPEDLALVTDLVMPKQECTMATVDFDDEGIADFFDKMTELGKHPQEYARIWLHTHPGNSPTPSGTDEATFRDKFGPCDWAIMGILAMNDDTYCRLKYNSGPGCKQVGKFSVDYSCEFPATDRKAWKAEYDAMVTTKTWGTVSWKSAPTVRGYNQQHGRRWINGVGFVDDAPEIQDHSRSLTRKEKKRLKREAALKQAADQTLGIKADRNLLEGREDIYTRECYNCCGDFPGKINQSFCPDCRQRFGDISLEELKPFEKFAKAQEEFQAAQEDYDADIWAPEATDEKWEAERLEEFDAFSDFQKDDINFLH